MKRGDSRGNHSEELMRAFTATLLAATVLSTLPLAAQTTAPKPAAPATTTTTTTTTSNQWRASKLIGLDIYNEQNEKLGDVSEVLIDTNGRVTGLVIGVGGFLGLGQRDIMVTMDKLKFVNEPMRTTATTGQNNPTPAPAPRNADAKWYPDHAIMAGATKDALKNMPEFKYN